MMRKSGSLEDLERPGSRLEQRTSPRSSYNGHPRFDDDDDDVDYKYNRDSNSGSNEEDTFVVQQPTSARGRKMKKRQLGDRLRTSRDDDHEIASLYKDALVRAEKEIEDDERNDALGDLSRFSHSPPRPSAMSPEPLQRHTTNNSSFASSITSRTFKNYASSKTEPFGNLSQGSLQSTSVLPMISTREARNRSYLVGSTMSTGSLLGTDELERCFPDRKIRIFVGTWNMCEMKIVPDCLDDFILPETNDYVNDIYVIGTQESCPNRQEWEIRLQETLGPQHVLLHSVAHGVLYLCVFIRRDLIWYTSVCEEACVSVRAGPTSIKTKGAAAVGFTLFGTSFLFLDTHLTPHDGRMKDRINDYNKICSSLQLPKGTSEKGGDVTSRYDCVFWLGDLNFRIEKERQRIDEKVQGIEAEAVPNFEDLVLYDQLFKVRNEGLAFQEFQEGRIKFKPTYKYDIGSNKFDTSKKIRIPSYTDRVLFRCKKKHAVTCLHYDSVHEITVSDHKPVYGIFEVSLRPGRDNIQLNGGNFNKAVWLQANTRRAQRSIKTKDHKSSKVCSIQ